MPLSLLRFGSEKEDSCGAMRRADKLLQDSDLNSAKCIRVGLINNMPDAALEATERQYISLLNAASGDVSIQLSLYRLAAVPLGDHSIRHVNQFYSIFDPSTSSPLDGLIVTGREPRMPSLAEEPYWGDFVRLLAWAQENTLSTIWSCLAAHAAVFCMDGIDRIRNLEKHSGIFDCVRVSDHRVFQNTPFQFKLPHSRWNGLPEDALSNCGYTVLTRTDHGCVDTFIRQLGSLFVFHQGHPEYETNTLLLEYRRDVGRYLRVETKTYPAMPRDYFDSVTTAALKALENQALCRPRQALLTEASNVLENATIENSWRSTAVCIYRNWITHLYEERERRMPLLLAVDRAAQLDPTIRLLSTGPNAVDSAPVPQ